MDEENLPTLPKSSKLSRFKIRICNHWFIGGTIGFFLGVIAVTFLNMKWNGSLDTVAIILGAFGTLAFAILTVFKIQIFAIEWFELSENKMRKKQIEKSIALIALISLAISFAIQIYLHFLI